LGLDVQARRGGALRRRRAVDARPDLLFLLRQVDASELVARAGTDVPLSNKKVAASKRLADEDLDVFGLDLASLPDDEPAKKRSKTPAAARRPKRLRHDC
jgi:hypothetical protein